MSDALKGEILSPVGSWEMLEAAVRSGADAVYLGAKEFSARRNAENFDISSLKEAIAYCHIRSVKVYLALNILVRDDEIMQAIKLAENAYNVGIDAVIIQDLGLAAVLREYIPKLELHASTQMTVHTPAALEILKEMGFKRVVVSREMSRLELTEFCKKAKEFGIEVEVFVHGALCMSMSGQCLLSAYLGSRSGNRGLCAGPCRLPFRVENGTGYDLSLKDLSLTDYMTTLYEIGVTSFKIEGRMKRPEYVAAATAACRQALYNGRVQSELQEMLENVFSRSGFTAGYFENKLGRDMFGIRTKEDVSLSADALPKLHEYYRRERSSVKIIAAFKAVKGEKISLTLDDGVNKVTVYGDEPALAQNKFAEYDSVIKSLDKFGNTPYYLAKTEVLLDRGLYIPASLLNDLRRRAGDALSLKRAELKCTKTDIAYKQEKAQTKESSTLPKLYIRVENPCQIPDDLSGVAGVIVALENDFEPIDKKENIVDIPRGITSEKLICERLKLFYKKGFRTALCGNLSAVVMAKKAGFEIMADTGLNIHNSEALKAAKRLCVKSAILSNELLIENALSICSGVPKGIISYGNIPLMLFKNCPVKNGIAHKQCQKNGIITDRKGIEFPVRCRMGYSELLNSVPVWLADKQSLLKGLDFQVLYFTQEAPQRVNEVVLAYKNGSAPDTKYTRGLFFRGTI